MEALREEVKEERRSKGLLEADSVPTTFPGEVLSVHEKVDMEGERKMKEAVEAGKTFNGVLEVNSVHNTWFREEAIQMGRKAEEERIRKKEEVRRVAEKEEREEEEEGTRKGSFYLAKRKTCCKAFSDSFGAFGAPAASFGCSKSPERSRGGAGGSKCPKAAAAASKVPRTPVHVAWIEEGQIEEGQWMEEGQMPYVCETCGKAFSTSRNLTSHMPCA